MFEPRARRLYAVVAAEFALAFALIYALGISFTGFTYGVAPFAGICVLASGWGARRIGFTKTATWLEATTLSYLQAGAGGMLLFPATVWTGAYADWWLSATDKAMGFDFVALYRTVENWPLGIFYQSFNWEVPIAILALVLAKREPWTFVWVLTISLMLTIVIYPIAPAIGPVGYYGLGPNGLWVPLIEALRDGDRIVRPEMVHGMVSLPSFHTTVGVLVVWATWPIRWARWPFLLLNVGMIFAAIPVGQHYLIDIFAGAAVALFAVKLSR